MLEKFHQRVTHTLAQSFQGANVKSRGGVIGVEHHALRGHGPPAVIFDLQLSFRVYRVLFSLHVLGIEERRNEELGETVHACLEILGLNVEKVIRVVGGRVGVAGTAMGTNERLVAVDFRVLLGPDEQHVLEKVSEPAILYRVVILPAKGDERCCRFVGGPIRYQQNLELVVEF